MTFHRHEVNVDDQRAVGGEVVQLELGRGVEVLGRVDGAVARLRQRDRQLVEVDQAEPQLAPERHRHPLGDGYEGGRGWDLQLGEVTLGHFLSFGFLTVDLLHLASRSRLELLALSLRRRDSVLDRLAHRVVRVGDHLARLLGRILRPLDRLAARPPDRLASNAVDLATSRAGGYLRAGYPSEGSAKDEPTETAAAAVIAFGHS